MKSNFQATTKPKGLTCLEVFIFGTNISSSESVDPKSGCIYSVQPDLDLKVIESGFSSSWVNTS